MAYQPSNPEGAATFRGRASTFRIPGRAGTAGQKLMTFHNATGSGKIVYINAVSVDLYQTVVKAVTVAPPIVRVYRITAVPTGGGIISKTAKDSLLTSHASVVVTCDATSDGTIAGTALGATLTTMLVQEVSPRLITAAGYEPADRLDFLKEAYILLRAGEGICVELNYTLATQNPITDMWVLNVDWYEVNA